MTYYDIAQDSALTIDDCKWFARWCPEAIPVIEHCVDHPYTSSLYVFGTWDDYLDHCAYYDLDPYDPADAIMFDDAGLSGVVLIAA